MLTVRGLLSGTLILHRTARDLERAWTQGPTAGMWPSGPGSICHWPHPEEAEASPPAHGTPASPSGTPRPCSEPHSPSGRCPEHLLDQQQPDNHLIVDLKFHHQRATGLSHYLQESQSPTCPHPTACPFHAHRFKSLKTWSKTCSGYSSVRYTQRSGQIIRSVREAFVLPKGFK